MFASHAYSAHLKLPKYPARIRFRIPMATSAAASYLRIDPTAHVADKASLHTSSHNPHPIIIGAHCVIHPFARLDSSAGPITLGNRCVVWEKAQIGASIATTRRASGAATHTTEKNELQPVRAITVGEGTIIQPHAQIRAPASVGAKCSIGVAAAIESGAVLGESVTVASGTPIKEDAILEKGSVIFGDGHIRHPCRNADEVIQRDLDKAKSLREEGEEKHRVLMTHLVKGTAGGTRFTA